MILFICFVHYFDTSKFKVILTGPLKTETGHTLYVFLYPANAVCPEKSIPITTGLGVERGDANFHFFLLEILIQPCGSEMTVLVHTSDTKFCQNRVALCGQTHRRTCYAIFPCTRDIDHSVLESTRVFFIIQCHVAETKTRVRKQ
jgi:hypothetical protein